MNILNETATTLSQDQVLRSRIRAEVKALLRQRAELAQLEKMAALRESTVRVAHDVRNPLATIQAVCDSLILDAEDVEQRERLQLISSQVAQVASTLATVIDGTSGWDEPPTLVDVGILSHSLVHLLQYQTQDDIQFQLELDPELRCLLPERGLTRCLYHLLHNAVNAVSDRNRGEIRVVCRSDGKELEIQVADNGPGLPSELIEHGLKSYSKSHRGSALGLCSVERFAQSLGGRLAFSNPPTGGALVSMWLPIG